MGRLLFEHTPGYGTARLEQAPAAVRAALERKRHPLTYLTNVQVHAALRHKGRSAMLLAPVMEHADEQRYDVWLYAKPFTERPVPKEVLVRIYYAWGFTLLPPSKCVYDEIEMVRRWRPTKQT